LRPIAGKPGSHRYGVDLKISRYVWERACPDPAR